MLIVCFVASGSATLAANSESDTDAAIAELGEPLVFAERFPSLRFLSYLMGHEPQPHLRAISELSRSKDPAAAPGLIAAMADPAFPFRFEAGVALQDVPSPVSVPALIALIEEDDPRLTRMAARVLGRVARGLMQPPEGALDDWQPALEANGAIDHARETLIELARRHPNEVIRVAALSGLISLGTEGALRAVYEIGAKDSHEMVRCHLLSSTGEFMSRPRNASVTPGHLRTILRKSLDPGATDEPLGIFDRAYYESLYFSRVAPEGERRSDCVDANEKAMWWLASLNDPVVIPHLIRAAKSRDPALQAVAGWGLPRFNNEQAFEQIDALLESPYSGVRSAAIDGLGRSRHPGADARLMRVLEHGSRIDRREAARALAGSFGASLALIDAFTDRAVEVRDEAERALLRSDVVVRKLEDSLSNALAEIDAGRGSVAVHKRVQRFRDGLAKWQEERREAERSLIRGLGAENPRVRIRSGRILSRYASESSMQLLIETLDAAQQPSGEAAALALGLRGEDSARESLERAALSDREDLSVAAIRALQDLDEPASLPVLRALQATESSLRKADAVRYTIAILERTAARDRKPSR